MNKQEHLMYFLGQMQAKMQHITSTSYKDMSQAQEQMCQANGYFLQQMEAIFAKPDIVNPGTQITIHGGVKLWTSENE